MQAQTGISIHNVLCPTDFSEFSERALVESIRVARWFGAKVTVLHVIPSAVPTALDMGYLPVAVELTEAARRAHLESLGRFVGEIGHEGVPVDVICREGDACAEIRNVAREITADLIVMGSHGRSGFKRIALGSVTESLLVRPPAPVLVVRGDAPGGRGLFRRVLCAADLSERSADTIGFAVALAGEGAEHLTVLSVVEDLESVQARLPCPPAGPPFRVDVERATIAELQRRIPDEARVGSRIEELVTFGPADLEILRIASEERDDLIVLGTHGHGAVDRVLFGSTVRRVVRGAECPVVVVPAGHAWPVKALMPARHRGAYGNSEAASRS
jgi:nucleotide-binding universal stress UspA family protein